MIEAYKIRFTSSVETNEIVLLRANPKFPITVLVDDKPKTVEVEFLKGDNNRQDFRTVDPHDPILMWRERKYGKIYWDFCIMSPRREHSLWAGRIAKQAYPQIEEYIQTGKGY
jgi:hypothetical protein